MSSGVGPLHGVFVEGVLLAPGAECALRELDVVTLGPPGAGPKLQLHPACCSEQPPDSMEQPPDSMVRAGDLMKLLECTVCFGPLAHAVAPPCGHAACAKCLLSWMTRSRDADGLLVRRWRCPSCAGAAAGLHRRRDLDALVAAVAPAALSAEDLRSLEARARAGRDAMAAVPEATAAEPLDALSRRIDSLQAQLEKEARERALETHQQQAQLADLRTNVLQLLVAPPQEEGRRRRPPQRYGMYE